MADDWFWGRDGQTNAGAGGGYASKGAAGHDLPGRTQARACSVSELNRYVNALMKSDPILREIWVRGEISNYRPHDSGHHYFTLKDGAGAIRCVMFRSAASRLRFRLENGMKVVAGGSVSVYERDGVYQLYCEELRSDGTGDLYVAYEQMKARLAEEGLFDAENKRPLPLLPDSVCVITSPTGAVIQDILNVALRRFPKATIKLVPVQVQGETAAAQIARAVARVNRLGLADVIIVGRGGGSIEDLWAFNEEIVARAVAASQIPVVSAVGHETDFTICDFAADLRAPTPSAAAELVFPDFAALAARLSQADRNLRAALSRKAERARQRLERCRAGAAFTRPLDRVDFARMRLNGAEERLLAATRGYAAKSAARAAVLAARLNALSPLAVLGRGYAYVTDSETGKTLRSARDTGVGRGVAVRLGEGGLVCEVRELRDL
ncbi:MAG: exodeoxyribonuclease VII large subunit [Clostridiales bacterium]|jgi:exodeoxyribonuclease VII large subunit|nr:exodeoxyribonuclease VII large subunit [Clostridiales bacterium]